MMDHRARVCFASWDVMLLRSHTMMLGAYFSVQPAGRFLECLRLVRWNPYDLLVLCYTLGDLQQENLASIARRTYSPTEVLVLQTHLSVCKPYADHLYDVTGGPWQLTKKCAEIVGYRIKSDARRVGAAAN